MRICRQRQPFKHRAAGWIEAHMALLHWREPFLSKVTAPPIVPSKLLTFQLQKPSSEPRCLMAEDFAGLLSRYCSAGSGMTAGHDALPLPNSIFQIALMADR